MEYPSKAIENAVNELANLPGIGKKTALRLALHILKQTEENAEKLGESIITLRKNIRYCDTCFNISDEATCNICSNQRRNKEILCVVEDTKDVIALENTHQFNGLYHVLGGLINPLQGIGPSLLNIDPLIKRISESSIKEVIFAFSANIEGDTTAFYITKKLKPLGVKISSIARGIPVGLDLEFTDEVTLARSILNRTQITASE
ncbi:MAG: recombination protein RecR [Bacteroidetes bacterium]|nr:recombination protein RecR [Bacteroidota bacterium]MCB0844752.1 recombination protein RecR [Bacteroidota bacterium]MCB0853793.1 recombination protein RecR [Bacteroidota bacterium]